MSVWCEISGTCRIRKRHHISLKEVVSTFLAKHEYSYTSQQEDLGNFWCYHIDLSICCDGAEAHTVSSELMSLLSEVTEHGDFTSSVRWLWE